MLSSKTGIIQPDLFEPDMDSTRLIHIWLFHLTFLRVLYVQCRDEAEILSHDMLIPVMIFVTVRTCEMQCGYVRLNVIFLFQLEKGIKYLGP